MSEALTHLNERQKEAVLQTEGPLLILAGAGAGKTKTLTHRMLHLIENGVKPHEILAITFTNKAAKEMRERVGHLIESALPDTNTHSKPFVSTFHSLGVHIIKQNAALLGLTKYFTIFDRGDSKRAVKLALERGGYDTKQYDPANILSMISKQKGDAVTLQDYTEKFGTGMTGKVVALAWKFYEETLKKEKALDFDDLLLKSLYLLQKFPDVLEYYQNTWKYIHIDEYQDTNTVQYTIAKLLGAKHQNVCAVGDIDQNIYSWRGADIKNILNFEKDYPQSQIILLEENYRSTEIILEAANTVIKKNKNRREKNLFTSKKGGEKITVFGAFDENDEADFVASKTEELLREGVSPDEIAVLYRANFQSRALEEAFLTRSMPYQVLGTKFYERKEIKDIVSFIKLAVNPDSFSDMKRVINVPARGLGKTTLEKLEAGMEESLSPAIKEKIQKFRDLVSYIKNILITNPPSVGIREMIDTVGIIKMYQTGKEDDDERIENIKELIALSTRYDDMTGEEGILKFLEDASLASDQDELDEKGRSAPKVKLMTVHASKGLEFDYVFIPGLETDLFPHKRMSESKITSDAAEEERRLFYVALTRARLKLYLSYASMRTVFGMRKANVISEFILDIPEELTEEKENNLGVKAVFIDF